jgi:hypothetical protein
VRSALLLAVLACSGRSEQPSAPPQLRPAPDAAVVIADADTDAAVDALDVAIIEASAPLPGDERWLKGSTHVHAKPSGDSSEPVDSVVRWYEDRGYDFIALTDHNKITPVEPPARLIVIPGVELTHNRKDCEPPGDASRQCRIHINALGVTARPEGKIEWTDYKSKRRVELYEKAYATAKALGATVIQINHPQYYWGMTPEVLIAIGKGAQLVEIANVQFAKWNKGDDTHPSTEALWDAALVAGLSLWGVATDDAHDYGKDGGGRYPAGGGWVVVKARRDAQAILAALAAGRFYSSTGVELSRAERAGDELIVEVAPGASGQHAIAFVENGKLVATTNGPSAKRVLPQTGYVRAVVTRDDGKQAWVQPVRR